MVEYGAVVKYLEKRYGCKLEVQEGTVSVGTTPTLLLKNDPDRFMWSLVNLSSNSGFIAFSPAVSPSMGMLITGNGGERMVIAEEDGPLSTAEVWGVQTTEPGTWYYVIVRAYGK